MLTTWEHIQRVTSCKPAMTNAAHIERDDGPDLPWAVGEAERVLRDNRMNDAPISVLEIAEAYGYRVVEADFAGELRSLASVYDPKAKTIYVPQSDPFPRKAFSVAQAIGHLILHGEMDRHAGMFGTVPRQPIASEEASPREKEAIAFAAHLLVPDKILSKYRRFATPSDLATLFAVPNDVIRYRTGSDAK